jgi:hypothetical protein
MCFWLGSPETIFVSHPRHCAGLYRFGLGVRSVDLREGRLVHVEPERAFYGAQVRFVAVRRELHA